MWFELTCNYCLVSRHWLMITSFLFHVWKSFHVEIQNYFMFDDQITCYHHVLCNMKSVWNMKLISCLHEIISCFVTSCNMKLFSCLLEKFHVNHHNFPITFCFLKKASITWNMVQKTIFTSNYFHVNRINFFLMWRHSYSAKLKSITSRLL